MMDETAFKNTLMVAGPAAGFVVFLVGTATMDGIYFRPDDENKSKFTVDGLWEYIKAPFQVGTPQFKTVWTLLPNLDCKSRLKMLQLNWVATVGAGALVSYGLSNFF